MEPEIYEITTRTCALVAQDENKTKIIEEDKTFIIDKPISQILDESCQYYGSSLKGRIQGSKTLLGMCYKLPIIIESNNEIIFFPIMSPCNAKCSWLSVKHIKDYKSNDNNVVIKFKGNRKYLFPITYESLENQMFRATKLMLLMRNHQNIK